MSGPERLQSQESCVIPDGLADDNNKLISRESFHEGRQTIEKMEQDVDQN